MISIILVWFNGNVLNPYVQFVKRVVIYIWDYVCI